MQTTAVKIKKYLEMGLFDFLKPKRNSTPKNIDEIFDLASTDAAYRPLFYRTILESELYLLIYSDENLPNGKFVSEKDIQLKIRMFSDGTVPLFTSEDRIYDGAVIKEKMKYVAMKGRVIFNLFPDPPRMFLNPYSRPSKELLPDEIRELRNGELFSIDEEIKVPAGSTIQIAIPSNYPTALVAALKKYASTREEISEIYLALAHYLQSNEAPHLLIGIKASKHIKEILEEAGTVIKQYISKGKFVDMINISHKGQTASILRNKDYRIY